MGNTAHRPLTITTVTSSPRIAALNLNSTSDTNDDNNDDNLRIHYDSDSGYYNTLRRNNNKKKTTKKKQLSSGDVVVAMKESSSSTSATTQPARHVFLKNYYHNDKDVEVFAKQLRSCSTKNPITQFHITHYPNGVLSRKGYTTLFDAMERNYTIELLGLELLSNDMDIPRMICNVLRFNKLSSCTKLELLLSNTNQLDVSIEFLYALIKNTTIQDLKLVCNGTTTTSSTTSTTTTSTNNNGTATAAAATAATVTPPYIRKDSNDDTDCRRKQQLGETFQKLLEQNTTLTNIYFHNFYRTGSMGDDFVEYFAEGLKYNRSLKTIRFTITTTRGILAIADALRYNTTLEQLFIQSTDFEAIALIGLFEALEDNETLKSLTLHAGYRLYKLNESIVVQSMIHSMLYNDTLQYFKYNRYIEGTRNNLLSPIYDIVQQNRTTALLLPKRIAPLKQYKKRIQMFHWLLSNNITEW